MKTKHKSLPRQRYPTEPQPVVTLNDLISDITFTRDKIDEQLSHLDQHMAQIIKGRLTKFVALHTAIIESKDQQYADMKQHYQKIKMSQLHQNIVRLEKKIHHLEQEVQRVNSVKDLYRKETDRLKMDLQIKERELLLCNKRQKQLIRHVWVLQEDIKDLYYYQSEPNQPTSVKHNVSPKTPINTPLRTRYKPQTTVTHTQPDSQCRLESSCPSMIPSMIESKYLNFKQSGVTKLREKFGASLSRAKPIIIKSKPKLHLHAPSLSEQVINSPQHVDLALYEQVKEQLRKQSQKEYEQPPQDHGLLTADKFRLICLHGLRIMKRIEKIVLDRWGHLQEVDESSLAILDALFRSQRAVKIMEIILFSYSHQALTEIKKQSSILTVENQYDLPVLENTPKPLPSRPSQKKNFQQELLKKFKNPQRYQRREATSHSP